MEYPAGFLDRRHDLDVHAEPARAAADQMGDGARNDVGCHDGLGARASEPDGAREGGNQMLERAGRQVEVVYLKYVPHAHRADHFHRSCLSEQRCFQLIPIDVAGEVDENQIVCGIMA